MTSSPWVDGLTFGQTLDRTAAAHAAADALVFPKLGLRLSWREFRARVDDVARGLMAMGIERGDHIAVWATNVPEWVLLQFATARIGAVLVNINPAYRPFELRYVLQQSDAKALFLVERFKSSDYFAMLHEVCPELSKHDTTREFKSADFPRLKNVISLGPKSCPGAATWDHFLRGGAHVSDAHLAARAELLHASDPINIQYTSGTTGFPKAAMLSHRNLLLNAYYVGECQKMSASDRLCIPVPFYHCFGCVLGTLACVVHGAAMIVPNEYFVARDTLDAIERERATMVYGVPTMYIGMLEDETLPGRDVTSLRTGIMSGAPCPIEVMRKVLDRLHIPEITIAYGQTEASPVITQTRTDDPVELRVETVGRPLPGWEVRTVDPASGKVCGDHEPGELCARGHGVMLGYYKNPEATAAAIREGWLHTGDIAVRLPGDYYKITGRIKDMIIRGGENIYPREIEEFLFTHPAIEQVSVIGLPDSKYGEEVCAWIKLKAGATLTEAEVTAFCRQNLAHFKAPRYVRFVEAFPQTVTGKIQKFKMREQMMTELGLIAPETA